MLLITSRNHRIHHLQDRESQMHNFGAVFSIWDRVFSTYSSIGSGKEAVFGASKASQKSFLEMQKETVMQLFK